MFEQDRVITRLQQRVMREPAIAACFLSGSFGKRRDDGYSDLDVALLFDSDASRELLPSDSSPATAQKARTSSAMCAIWL